MNKITVILAHPDDAEIWVGGTILNHIDYGDKIHVLYLFADNEERKKEAKLLNKIPNIEVTILSSTDIIRPLLKDFRPNILITHWEKDNHHEHQFTYYMVASLIPLLIVEDGLKFNLYSCDTYNSVGSNNDVFLPNVYIDISNTWLRKIKLIMNHKSQPTDYWISMVENQNRLYGSRTKSNHAEAFLQINTLGYTYSHEKILR